MNSRTMIEYELQDVFDIYKRDTFLSMNCHAIGKITKFKSSDQTAEIEIAYTKKFLVAKSDTDMERKEFPKKYPLLVDCPVMVLTGGDTGLSMPIKEGDDCIVLFNDRDIDNWFLGTSGAYPNSDRLHSLSDGIAIVGIRSLKNSIENFDSDNPVLYNKDTKITVKEDKVKIENTIESLNDILQDLINEIKDITTTNAVVGAPSTISIASKGLLAGVATRLGALIE